METFHAARVERVVRAARRVDLHELWHWQSLLRIFVRRWWSFVAQGVNLLLQDLRYDFRRPLAFIRNEQEFFCFTFGLLPKLSFIFLSILFGLLHCSAQLFTHSTHETCSWTRMRCIIFLLLTWSFEFDCFTLLNLLPFLARASGFWFIKFHSRLQMNVLCCLCW